MPDRSEIAGRYRVRSLLGEGGYGRVYLAEDPVEGRDVAVKLIRRGLGRTDARLEREAAALRHLRIPGVVRLLDAGRHEGDIFLVMEYVIGRPFPGTEAAAPWPELAPIVARLLDLLARVHAAGVLHRDLKPGNVLVTPDQRVVLVDFGLAGGESMGASITGSNEFLGTFRYLSPEQLESGRVDIRSELFAVGLMIYEALLGRPALPQAEAGRQLRHRLTRELTPIRMLVPDLPMEVGQFVDRLVRRNPDERPRSAGEALRLLRGDPASSARGPTLPRLGSRRELDRLVAEVEAGRSVTVSGPPGSGRSRLILDAAQALEARGRRVCWVAPGASPFESLRHLVGRPSGDDPQGWVLDRLLPLLSGSALFADDLADIDRASRVVIELLAQTHTVVRVADGPNTIRLAPLTELDLRPLFHGPDRVLHLREDAAQELHRRTAGRPGHVVRELSAWEATGLARWEMGRIRISREALDGLMEGIRGSAPLPDDAAPGVDGRQRDLLAWVALAGEAATVTRLAEAMGQDRWETQLEIDSLVDAGVVGVDEDGRVRMFVGTGDLLAWPLERRQAAHAALARAMPPGTEGRLGHLIEGGGREEAVRECIVVAAHAAERGRPGRAFNVFHAGLSYARECGMDEAPLLIGMASTAGELDSVRRLETLAYEAARARPSPGVAAVGAVAGCMLAAVRGELAVAEAAARALGPCADEALEAERITVLLRCTLALHPEWAGDFMVAIEPFTVDSPLLHARWTGWVGLYFRTIGRYREAIDWHLRAARFGGSARYARSGLFNAAICAMDADEPGIAREAAIALRRSAREAWAPSFELRAEAVLRDLAMRAGTVDQVDMELVLLVELIASPIDYVVYFQESVMALRLGQRALAQELAARCRAIGVTRDHRVARVGGEVVVRAAGGAPAIEDASLRSDLRALPTARLRVQFAGELALVSPPEVARELLHEMEADYVSLPPSVREQRLEITSPTLAIQRVRAHLGVTPGW